MGKKILTSLDQLIGNTPMMELVRIEKHFSTCAKILAKLEFFNPGGSVKDRVAAAILDEAEKSGKLKPGGMIIEPTSGNTGIGLAAVAASRGYKLVVTMPETMSIERRKLIAAYGAEIVLTPGTEGMKGAMTRAEELLKTVPGSFLAGQFINPANPDAHRKGTGPEIYADTDGQVDIFVAGVGTGGTLTGIGEYLKSRKPDVRIVAVEPFGSPVLSGGKPGSHQIQGIGAGFVPEILNTRIFDEVVSVSDEDAFATGKLLAKTEGLLVGISSGAAAWCAIELALKPENANKNIVVLLPDDGSRYFSTTLFADDQA